MVIQQQSELEFIYSTLYICVNLTLQAISPLLAMRILSKVCGRKQQTDVICLSLIQQGLHLFVNEKTSNANTLFNHNSSARCLLSGMTKTHLNHQSHPAPQLLNVQTFCLCQQLMVEHISGYSQTDRRRSVCITFSLGL